MQLIPRITPLTPSVAELLNERISDAICAHNTNAKHRALVIELAAIAVPAVLEAGAAGNVTCKTAAYKILALLK